LGQRFGVGFGVPVVPRHDPDEPGVDEPAEVIMAAVMMGRLVLGQGAAADREVLVRELVHPADPVVHPVDRLPGKIVIEIKVVELVHPQWLGRAGEVIVVVEAVGVEEDPLAVLVVPDLADLGS
jgi:hypothetical protein